MGVFLSILKNENAMIEMLDVSPYYNIIIFSLGKGRFNVAFAALPIWCLSGEPL